MKLLLLGSKGSIGRRYTAVLNALQCDYETYDNPLHEVGSRSFVGYSHFLIATPTHTHLALISELSAYDHASILCEKPISKQIAEIKKTISLTDYVGLNCYVVNNYQFLPSANTRKKISYNFYNTGKDGLIWDTCQLVYMAWLTKQEIEVKRESFWWDLKWGQHQVYYHEIERSYYHMLKAFISGDTSNLWNLSQALKMSELCEDLTERAGNDCEYFNWRSSTDGFISFSPKGLRVDRAQVAH